MSDWMSFFIGLLIFLSAGILFCRVLFVYRSYKESVSDSDIQKTQELLEATKVFVRDPNDFKDKDRDGIDDIIDTKID